MSLINRIKTKVPNTLLAVVLSLILPGLGQIYQKRSKRGTTIMILAITAFLAVFWHKDLLWYIPLALFWMWNILDVIFIKGVPILFPILLWLIIAYGIGIKVTDFRISALFQNQERAMAVIEPMLHPRLFESKSEVREGWVFMQVPCSAEPPIPDKTIDGVRVYASPSCAN